MTEGMARQRARDWWKDKVASGESVNIRRLCDDARTELANDPEFRESFIDDFFDSVMYEMGQKIVASTRAELRTHAGLRRQVEEDAKRYEDQWQLWLEYDPGTACHIPLTDMTKEQVLVASDYRLDQAMQNETEARWLERIAAELQAGQRVGDVLSNAQLSELRRDCDPFTRKVY